MAEFSWRAFQGQADTWQVKIASSGFTGSEALTATVFHGGTDTASLVVTPTWTVGTIQTSPPTWIDVAFTGAQLAALPPGPYAVLIAVAGGLAPLAKGLLEVYPAPAGTPPYFERALATVPQAQATLTGLTQQHLDAMPAALRAATRAIETYCQRPLVLSDYDHVIRPQNSRKLRLRSRPVATVSRVAAGLLEGLQITNTATGVQSATVQQITASPYSLALSSLVLSATVSGVTTPATLTIASYTTLADLAAAITALGNGWTVKSDPNASSYLCSDIMATPGTRGCYAQEYATILTHTLRLGSWWVDSDQGIIELDESIPGGFLIANPKLERIDSRFWGARTTYRAGYATQAADIALGYYTVPDDLAEACVMTAYSILESAAVSGPVKSQTVKDRSYTLRDSIGVIPDYAKGILASYVEVVI